MYWGKNSEKIEEVDPDILVSLSYGFYWYDKIHNYLTNGQVIGNKRGPHQNFLVRLGVDRYKAELNERFKDSLNNYMINGRLA